MDTVFLLWHVQVDDEDDERLIGVYATEALAKSAIDRAVTKPGFRESPDRFQICPYELNKDNWVDGFASATGLPAWMK